MRFERIRTRGLGPYQGEVDVNLAELDARVVAVTGDNGAGKSTLLELLAGALYRTCPTRGPLARLATGRDAYVEVEVVNGSRHTIRQSVDALSKKGETLITDAAGAPVVHSAKVSDADHWVAEHLPSPGELYASAFAVQGSRGVLDLKPGERKALLLRMLGIEHLEQLADRARERAREAKAEVDRLRTLRDEKAEGAAAGAKHAEEAERLAAELALAEERAEALEEAVRRTREVQADAQRAAELAAQRRAVVRRLDEATAQRGALRERIANNRRLLERQDEIEDAVRQRDALRARATELREESDAAVRDYRDAEAGMRRASAAAQEQLRLKVSAQDRARRAQARLKDADAVAAAEADLPEARAAYADVEAKLAGALAELARLTELRLSLRDRRIAGLADPLRAIAEGAADDPEMVAGDALTADGLIVGEGEVLPELIEAARTLQDELTAERLQASERVRHLEQLAARTDELAAARRDLSDAEHDEREAELKRHEAAGEAAGHEVLAQQCRGRHDTAERALEEIGRALRPLEPALALLPRLEQAQARIEELEGQLPAIERSIEAAQTELSGLPDVEAAAGLDLEAQERQWREAQRRERDLGEQLGGARAVIKACADLGKQADALGAELAQAEDVLGDYTRLAQDLGRDGLQAMEIDAAVPELNTLANGLLHSCHGSRFTVDIRTDRLSADGKRVLEGLDVRVIDTERGRDELAETYSGGECVIVGEAVALALTMLACRRSGVDRPTIIRDESGAALDPDNARAYVAMLRQAADMVGADKVLFVSHNQETQDLADARLHVSGGKVEVRA